jgi:TolB-like protein
MYYMTKNSVLMRDKPVIYNFSFAVSILILVLVFQDADAVQNQMESQLEYARQAYRTAQFDQAIYTLMDLTENESLSRDDKKEAFRLLGLSYTAKGLYDKAKAAIQALLELEPPLVELDPDREPPKLMKIYYEARKDVSGNYEVERPDPGIKTIAVLDFQNSSVDDKEKFDPLEKGFASLLINQLNGMVNLKVIERERIHWIMNEIGMENDPGKFDTESAVRVGKQLGVHTILLGSFIKYRDDMWLGARLVKVETSEIIMTEDIKGEAKKFFELSTKLASKISEKINVELSAKELGEKTETRSLDAMLSYSEGLEYLEKGDYQKAYQKFQKALEYDPGYEKARLKSESIKPLIS